MKQHLRKIVTTCVTVTAAALTAGVCTACSTTAFESLGSYFADLGEIVNPDHGSTGGSAAVKTPLATPTEFTVGEDGTYSFKGVENANSYIIYLYGSDGTDDAALYSGVVAVGSVNDYSGKLSDMIDYVYGSYRVELVAYAKKSSAYTDSAAVKAGNAFIARGDLSAPQIEYKWDGNGTMKFQLRNSTDYALQVVPNVTLTVTGSDGDTTTVKFDEVDVTTEYVYCEVKLKAGVAYTVTSVAATDSAYVNSKTVDGDRVDISELSNEEIQSDDYTERRGPGGPGGPGGASLSLKGISVTADGGIVTISMMGQDNKLTATVTETADGSAYSFTLSGKGGMGEAITGNLELLSDGTLGGKVNGFGPFSNVNIKGTWEEADGIITVSLGK